MPKASKFKKVDVLPTNAVTMLNYAKKMDCSVQYIYKLINTNKANFEVINFQGINFVIE